ncbi:MAG: Uma2 family endonuclease [Pyrinomonadaceae bacterium]
MATVISPPEQAVSQPVQRVILSGVSWETYESLLGDFRDRSVPHFTYDEGTLEIMSPSRKHEEWNRNFAALIEQIALELNIEHLNLGSTTFKRKKLKKGFEPDTCFYFQNVEALKGKEELDLKVDPPPDLIIEIDIYSGSLKRFPIYAKFGVPEIWRYDGKSVQIFQLAGDEYRERESSVALPMLSGQVLSERMEASKSQSRLEWLRSVREWARRQGGKA